MKKLFLIDGHSLIFRMYYAFLRRPMINTKGVDTSILFGFMKYLLELIKKENPSHLGVAFDPPGKTFRHEMYDQYKANRSATPELVKSALEPLIEMVKSLGIPVIMVPGFEADDVIGAMAKKWESNGYQIYMVTPDKDLGQLVSDNILQYKPGKSGADNEICGKKEICDKFGIQEPIQVIDILAIWGDASDNVPGVRGVGEVGAKKLISTYGSIENIMQHLDELTPKQRDAFQEADLKLSKDLVTIKTNIDINYTEEDLKLDMSCNSGCRELFDKYEFGSLLPLLPTSEAPTPKPKTELKYSSVGLDEITATAMQSHSIAIRIKDETLYLADSASLFQTNDFSTAKELLEDFSIKKIGYDLKEYIKILRHKGIPLEGELADIELMHYLINPERAHRIDILAQSYLGLDVAAPDFDQSATIDEPEPDLFSSMSDSAPRVAQSDEHTVAETLILTPLHEAVNKELSKDNAVVELYELIEMPLIRVLADMEYEGFKIDTLMLAEYRNKLASELDTIEARIREAAGEPTLNISSPRQLGIVLFEKLNLDPSAKKTNRDSYTTDEETLQGLADKHPIINDILEFRGLKKLISTYIEPLPALIDPRTGKIHTTFNQALTATGRLSSVRPNLQNIPIRTDLGREIRKAFIPSRKDGYIISADYSQIELRIMACVSGDEGMIEDFRHGKDIHTATAARVFHTTEEEVTKEQRRKAKVANFGIIYGISPFGLSQRLNIPRSESKAFIEEYFKNYPTIHAYMERIKEQARETGYVETICKRKRYLPGITSKNQVVRGLAERNAINAPIQGSAADIIKIAMINVAGRLKKEQLKSRMILQVHDELVFDVIDEERERVLKVVKEEMENVLHLDIPLTAECNYGKNWLEAH